MSLEAQALVVEQAFRMYDWFSCVGVAETHLIVYTRRELRPQEHRDALDDVSPLVTARPTFKEIGKIRPACPPEHFPYTKLSERAMSTPKSREIDRTFDYVGYAPCYSFCMIWYPDYPENCDEPHEVLAVGEYLCLTPPVIPQE